ncbi:phosphotransferase [Mycolicibacterium palauense]|uniref:phosphotransferase n=1 Tax=Mycolicibacterium palauense TaxID=2034511 RepID=UPI000BFEE83E|nr:phosphotransferase [Mycolicibacterium palauense]
MTATALPTTIEALTPGWLTDSLRASGGISADAEVVSFDAESIGEGVGFTSYLYRLKLTLSNGQVMSVVAKLPTTTDYLQIAKAFRAYAREVAFYAAVAPQCPLNTPVVHVAEIDSEGHEFIILMEDLGYLENGDHVAGIPFERAERVVDQLALLHAWGWDLPSDEAAHPEFEGLDSPAMTGLFTMGIAAGWETYRPKARVPIPPGLSELIEDWPTRLPRMVAELTEPVTVVNGDLRVDNMFFDSEGSPTIVDFQMTMRAAGIWDVAYLVGQGMTPTQRAGRERELVARYVDGLAKAGITYSFDEAWRQFRVALVAQLTYPLTAGMSWDGLNDRARELLHALNERAFAIIADTDALQALPD